VYGTLGKCFKDLPFAQAFKHRRSFSDSTAHFFISHDIARDVRFHNGITLPFHHKQKATANDHIEYYMARRVLSLKARPISGQTTAAVFTVDQ
jgi:hypothetical protein